MGTYSDLVQTPPSPTLKEEKKQETKKRTFQRSVVATNQRSKEQTMERTVEPTHHPTNGRTFQRTKIRHTFDIFADQIQALHQLQLEYIQAGGLKPKLGDMIQEALDDFLTKKGIRKKEQKTERSNERP